jgi:gliding motility-associated-like protein
MFVLKANRQKATLFLLLGIFFLTHTAVAQNAEFSANITSGCFPLTVKFTDASTGPIATWAWDFGNTNSSDAQSPSAVYTTPGIYTVSLTVTNGAQSDTETKTGYITVFDYPTADFSFDISTGCAPLAIKFKDQSIPSGGTLANWSWIFGDGGTSDQANPTYSYVLPGDRTVSLKVTNDHGCSKTKVIAPAIHVEGPTVKFLPSTTVICAVPEEIVFTNQSTGNGALTYAWTFGDGGAATATNPTHTFTKQGPFTVELKATDPQGCAGGHTEIIGFGDGGGVDFESSATKVCVGTAVDFSIQATAPILFRSWDFGDGITSMDLNPEIVYTIPGSYKVTLDVILKDRTCHSIVSKIIDATLPIPSFTFAPGCAFDGVLTSTSTGVSRLEWYVDGNLTSTASSFTYAGNSPGTKSVTLIVFNSIDCSAVLERDISIAAKTNAVFLPSLEQDCSEPSLSGCAPFTIQITNKSTAPAVFSSLWDFGDGTTSFAKDPLHTYQVKGVYTLSLTVRSTLGCQSTATAKVTVADTKPVAKFIFDKKKVCEGDTVKFTDQSTNASFWCWDFGDGMTASGKEAKHQYHKPGIYTVRLTAKNGGCTDTIVETNAVEVTDPYIDFAFEKNCTDPLTLKLQNVSQNYQSILWDFGDGNQSATEVTSYHYAKTGSYVLSLTGTNDNTHCTVRAFTTIVIQQVNADFDVDNPLPCKGGTVKFTNKSTGASEFEWTVGGQPFSTDEDISQTFKNPGTYGVTLNVLDSDKCAASKNVSIKVLDVAVKFDFQATSTCDSLAVQFNDLSISSSPLLSWNWDFGDGHASSDQNPLHKFGQLKKFPVSLTLTNVQGSCRAIKDAAITFTNPVPEFSTARQGHCLDEKITLNNLASNAISFSWNLGNGQVTNARDAQVFYSKTGDYTIALSATDKFGCTKTISKPAFISITKPEAIFDAEKTSGDCPPLTTIFRDHSTGEVEQWLWNFGDGSNSILSNPANTYVKPGAFNVRLVVTDANGCKDSTSAPGFVQVGGPYGSFTSDVTESTCENKIISFTTTTQNVATFRWDYGDGFTEDKIIDHTEHYYKKSGQYVTSLLLIDDKGCVAVADTDIRLTIKDTTAIFLEHSPVCIFEGDNFRLEASALKDEVTWTWKINGKILPSPEAVQNLTSNAADLYKVVLLGTNKFGCTSVARDTVPVQGNLSFIPNVFTPNGDIWNNAFRIVDLEKSKWDIHIFNRWGETVYKKSGYTNDWDGGDLAPGVYYYILINSYCDYKKYKGDLSIVR